MYAKGQNHINQLREFQRAWKPSVELSIRRAHETVCYCFEEYLPEHPKHRSHAIALIAAMLRTSLAEGASYNKNTGYIRIFVEHEKPGLKPSFE